MSYAHVTNGTVDQIGTPPATGFAQGRWWDLRTLDPAALAATGWVEATTTPRPADTATTTHEPTWAVVNGRAVQSWTERPKTADEEQSTAEQAARAELDANLLAGIAQIIAARNAATADIVTANTLRTDALAVRTAANTQRTQIDAFAPGTTYRQSDIVAIRTALSAILTRQALIIDTIASLASWRAAVDENAVITDNALLWLAKQATGDVLANEAARIA